MVKKLLIYSGHGQVVGGDVRYIVDIVNNLDLEKFDVTLFTDTECQFEKLSDLWLTRPFKVERIDTVPRIFSQTISEKIFSLSIFKGKIGSRPLSVLCSKFFNLLTFSEYRNYLRNYILFKRVISKVRPDIFWFNNGGYPGKPAGHAACHAAKNLGVKRVAMTFHNIPVPRRKFRFIDYLHDKVAHSSIDINIAVSKTLKEKLVELRGFSSDKISTLYCGVPDKESLTQEEKDRKLKELNLNPEHFKMIITGNLDEVRKGHEFLLSALGEVKKSTSEFTLIIVGGGKEKRIEDLKSFVSNQNLESNVVFLGHRFDIHELNCLCDLAIVPSLSFEATPYTIKEGYRAKIPAITTSIGGCPEGVIDKQTGFIVEPNDVSMLKSKIEYLMKNKSESQDMGKNGYQFFLDNFEMANQQRKIENLLLS